MTGLEQAFYIMAIVYMGIMFLVTIGIVIAIFAIKAKINAIHRQIEDKIHAITAIVHIGEEIIGQAKKVFHVGK